MTYKILTILLGIAVALFLLLLRFSQGQVKIFVKRTHYYLLGAIVLFALMGLIGGFVLRGHEGPGIIGFSWSVLLVCLGLGILHVWLMQKVLPWYQAHLSKLEWLFTVVLMLLGALFFFQLCIRFEKAGYKLQDAYADNLLPLFIIFPVPLLCIKAWHLWNAIPTVKITGWPFPFNQRPILIEPGKSVVISFITPLQHNSSETMRVEMKAPIDRTLGETFHFVVYRHNVEKKSMQQIELGENNSMQKPYSWLFYKKKRKWWWNEKYYLNPEFRIRQLGLQNGDLIFLERLRNW